MRLIEEDKEEILAKSDDEEQLPKEKAIHFAKKKTTSGVIRHLGEFKNEGSIYAGAGNKDIYIYIYIYINIYIYIYYRE